MLERSTFIETANPRWRDGQPHVLHRDFETRSPVILKTVGVHKYATDVHTEILCAAYAVDHEPVQLWIPGDPVPPEFIEAATNPDWIVVAHNDAFESAIERHVLAPRFGFPVVPPERHQCTMAMALALGLPARLDRLADALELSNRKDAGGRHRLFDYCKQDVEVERELYLYLPSLSPTEQALWLLNARINDRGFHVDRGFAEAARRIAQAAVPEIDAELGAITGGAVTGINQVARLLAWLQEQGCVAKDCNKKTVEKLLLTELAPPVRRVLELRLGGAQAATKKINALLARAGDDDRVRGSFRYHGAATGRWAGEGFQPQNLKRVTIKDIDAATAAVATGLYEHVRKLYERPLSVVGECSRSMITAAPGHVLIGADFSSIESRVLAHIAGEEWKTDSYRRFDATRDPRDEPYCITACKIFRVPPGTFTRESPQRSVGKTCDLAFGYMGGLGAWRKFEPEKFTDKEVEQFKHEWRTAHPQIMQLWHKLDHGAWTAVREHGRVVQCGQIAFKCTGGFLFMRLPNGRKISYPNPRVKVIDARKQTVVFVDNAAGQFTDCRHGEGAYGGTWTENAVSGIARDLLAEAMLRVEAAGYPIILTVHDEIVCEVPEGFGSTEEFTRLMTRVPSWASGLPIAAHAWSGPRYCK